MGNAITFSCCKHLIHSKGKYTDCVLNSNQGLYVYWVRREVWAEGGANPQDAQFCGLRGRLNGRSACVKGYKGRCSEYNEAERTVEID